MDKVFRSGTTPQHRLRYALSVQQPYAEMIAAGEKGVENRTWSTNFTGWLGIHASKSRKRLRPLEEFTFDEPLSFGALIAVVWMKACITPEQIPAFVERYPDYAWLAVHEHVEGPYCFVFSCMYRLTPIPVSGQRGLFQLDDDVVEQARAQVKKMPGFTVDWSTGQPRLAVAPRME